MSLDTSFWCSPAALKLKNPVASDTSLQAARGSNVGAIGRQLKLEESIIATRSKEKAHCSRVCPVLNQSKKQGGADVLCLTRDDSTGRTRIADAMLVRETNGACVRRCISILER